jgi:hypothetical protein
MSRKSIVARVLAIVVVVGAFLWVRSIWRAQRGGGAKASQKQVKALKADLEVDDEKSAPPEPRVKETVLGVAARGHLAEKAFISRLRGVLILRQGRTEAEKGRGELVEKLMAIPSDELPPERRAAWKSLLEAWRALADPAIGSDPEFRKKGQESAAVLNAMLKVHGDGDIQF